MGGRVEQQRRCTFSTCGRFEKGNDLSWQNCEEDKPNCFDPGQRTVFCLFLFLCLRFLNLMRHLRSFCLDDILRLDGARRQPSSFLNDGVFN